MSEAVREHNQKLYDKLDEFIESTQSTPGVLINVLHYAQKLFGYLPVELQEHIANKLNVPPSQVHGVTTFYNFFSTKPKGKYQIKVCVGTACYVKGGDKILERFKEELGVELDEPTEDGLFSVHAVRCVGACSMAPVVMVGEDDFYGRLTPDAVKKIINKYRGEKDGKNKKS